MDLLHGCLDGSRTKGKVSEKKTLRYEASFSSLSVQQALLFEIHLHHDRPVGLDEIEAALDDANIDTYADYLKSYSRNTQFIVITHRRGTMEEADVLYGVTMQEKGVSKMLTINLNDMAKELKIKS